MDLTTITLVILVAAAASTVQATIGSGLTLVAAPPLIVIDEDFVPIPVLVVGTIIAVRHVVAERRHIDRRSLAQALVTATPGVAVGLGTRLVLPETALVILTAVVIALSAAALLATPAGTEIPHGSMAGGFAGGFASITAGLPGPPIVIALQHLSPPGLRSTTSAFMLGVIAMTIVSLGAAGTLGGDELFLTLTLLPGIAIGFAAGRLLRPRVTGEAFRKTVLWIALVSAAAVGLQALL